MNLSIYNRKLRCLRNRIHKKSEHICPYCGKKLTLKNRTLDHIVPISLGGNIFHEPNAVICCRECNEEKGNLMLLEFLWNRNNDQKIHRSFEHKYPVIKGNEKEYKLHKEKYEITYEKETNINKNIIEITITAGMKKRKNHKLALKHFFQTQEDEIKIKRCEIL
jgi:DNA-directed RNA polymerase subunit RPC12/RpoP